MAPLFDKFESLHWQPTATELGTDEAEAFLKHESINESSVSSSAKTAFPWLLSAFFALTTLALAATMVFREPQLTYFPTDLPDARRYVQYEQKRFTGALTYDLDLKQIVRIRDSEVEYFGRPSDAIDVAWNDLLKGEFPVLTPEEAAPFLPQLKPAPNDGQYHFEPDVFHSLHCLNAIRIELSKTLYPDADPPMDSLEIANISTLSAGWKEEHLEHCMDRIRQVIMCHGDLTPSPLYYWKGFKVLIGRSGEHTCRKWGPIRKWMDNRNKLSKLDIDDVSS